MRDERQDAGAVAIFVAIFSAVIFLVAALVVDLGLAMDKRRDAQKAVDLAALAAGQELPDTDAAIDVAAQYLYDNGWHTVDGVDVSEEELASMLDDDLEANGEADFPTDTRLDLKSRPWRLTTPSWVPGQL